MIMSAPRTASAADCAHRTPAGWGACLSFWPCGLGNRISHADIPAMPVSCRPEAMAWPASPKPMKATVGLPFGILVGPCLADDDRLRARFATACLPDRILKIIAREEHPCR